MKHTIQLTMTVEAPTPADAEALGAAAGAHLLETFNDDESIGSEEGILSLVNPPTPDPLRLALRQALALLEDPEAQPADADRVAGVIRAALEDPEAQPTVWAAGWDVRNQGEGVELFFTEQSAIDAVMSWVDPEHLERAEMTAEEARAALTESGYLHFEDADCYYRVSQQEIAP